METIRHIRALALFLALPSVVLAQDRATADLLAAGDSLRAGFRYVEAIAAYDAAADGAAPYLVIERLAQTWNDHGMDLMADGRDDDAERAFERAAAYADRAVEMAPDSADAWFFRAAAYGNWALFRGGRGKVRLGKAVEDFSLRSIELAPERPLAYLALGIFYRELAQLNWVQRTFAKALFGGIPDGSYADSESYLRAALARDSTLTVGHFELGKTLRAMGRSEESSVHLRRAVELPPYNTQDVRNAAEARAWLQNR
jgi:tetratricopeptide (TPR) repeat protein